MRVKPWSYKGMLRDRDSGDAVTNNARLLSTHCRLSLTREGIGFLLLCAVLILASLNYNNTLALSFSVFLSVIFLLLLLHAWRNAAGLRLTGAAVEPVFCGEPIRLRLQSGPKPPPLLALRVMEPSGAQLRLDSGNPQQCNLDLTFPSRRRGLLSLDTVSLQSDYPLGICRVSLRIPLRTNCWVYPAPHKETFGVPTLVGEVSASGDDYAGIRPYHPGDAVQRIDWKACARSDRLLIKEFTGSSDDVQWSDWRDLASFPMESALSHLSAAVLRAAEKNILYGLKLPDRVIAPSRGEAHKHACLQALVLVDVWDVGY